MSTASRYAPGVFIRPRNLVGRGGGEAVGMGCGQHITTVGGIRDCGTNSQRIDITIYAFCDRPHSHGVRTTVRTGLLCVASLKSLVSKGASCRRRFDDTDIPLHPCMHDVTQTTGARGLRKAATYPHAERASSLRWTSS